MEAGRGAAVVVWCECVTGLIRALSKGKGVVRKQLVAHTGHGEVMFGDVGAAGVGSPAHLLIVRIFPGLSPRGLGPATYADEIF